MNFNHMTREQQAKALMDLMDAVAKTNGIELAKEPIDVKSKKSLLEHGIIADGGSIRLVDPAAVVRANAKVIKELIDAWMEQQSKTMGPMRDDIQADPICGEDGTPCKLREEEEENIMEDFEMLDEAIYGNADKYTTPEGE